MTYVGSCVFAITAFLSLHIGCTMSLKRHPQGATEGYYTFPSKNADKCLTGTKEYLQQVLDKLQSPNSSLRYVWYNSTVQQGYCPDRFMQHDKAGDLCFPDIEVWIDNDPTPILNTNHVRMGSLYKIRHHNFAFPNIKINHPVVMVECLNGTTIGGEAPVATSAVDADAKAVSLLATPEEGDQAPDHKQLSASDWVQFTNQSSNWVQQSTNASHAIGDLKQKIGYKYVHMLKYVLKYLRREKYAMFALPDIRKAGWNPAYHNAYGDVPDWIQSLEQDVYNEWGNGPQTTILFVLLKHLDHKYKHLTKDQLTSAFAQEFPKDMWIDEGRANESCYPVHPGDCTQVADALCDFFKVPRSSVTTSSLSGLIAILMVAVWSLQ